MKQQIRDSGDADRRQSPGHPATDTAQRLHGQFVQ
jgi:hypothetical protein